MDGYLGRLNEMTEQEQLAGLVKQEAREPLNTADMMAASLKKSLGSVRPDVLAKVSDEIEASGDVIEKSVPFSSITATDLSVQKKISSKSPPQKNIPLEEIIMALYQMHDNLISIFQKTGINSIISEDIVQQIKYVEKILTVLGVKVERFSPLDHVTGLTVPNIVKNARQVVETTKQCYSIGKVTDSSVSDDGKVINIVFTGASGNIEYKASGTISTENWMGNEAVDYVYTPNGGKMAIKCFEGGKWIEKGIKGRYEVLWDLEEKDLTKVASTIKEEKSSSIVKNNTVNENLVDKNKGKTCSSSENIMKDEEDLADFNLQDLEPGKEKDEENSDIKGSST